jgi:F420-dependent oxidoreductase-like protein
MTRTRMGLQIPNFTYPGVTDAELFDAVVRIAVEAEEAGFDSLFVMDHFYQLPMLGPPENAMLEAYTLLGALAARTSRVRLGTLVTGNTYRNPALLAKIVATLDVISGGRALCGVGAGWFEQEHRAYGFEYPRLGERLDRLEEALSILRPMLRGERPSLDGRFYRAAEALNEPAPLAEGGPPILIGGNGEKRTLRLVAQHAEESNLPCAPADVPRKLAALEGHCKDLGRDRASVGVSWLRSIVIEASREQAEAARNAYLARRGIEWESLPDPFRANIEGALTIGDPESVTESLAGVIGHGLDGIVVNLPANAHVPGAVHAAAEVLRKALGDAA